MKKALSVILSIAVLCSCGCIAYARQYQTGLIPDTWETVLLHSITSIHCPRPGDLDMNGQITTEDARLALRAAVGLEELKDYQRRAIASNGSVSLDTGKARDILRASVGITTLDFTACNFDKGQTIAFGPFANAGSGKYNWVCVAQNSELFQIEEKVISDENAVPGAPVRQYFFITALQPGTCDITFKLQDSKETECLAEYSLCARAGVLVGASAE